MLRSPDFSTRLLERGTQATPSGEPVRQEKTGGEEWVTRESPVESRDRTRENAANSCVPTWSVALEPRRMSQLKRSCA